MEQNQTNTSATAVYVGRGEKLAKSFKENVECYNVKKGILMDILVGLSFHRTRSTERYTESLRVYKYYQVCSFSIAVIARKK